MFELSLVQVIQAHRCLCGIAVDLQLVEEVNYVYSGRLIEYMWTSESIQQGKVHTVDDFLYQHHRQSSVQ